MPRRLKKLVDTVAALYPEVEEPEQLIRAGSVSVDGRVVVNPASVVGAGSSVALVRQSELRGEAKLRSALEEFDVQVKGRVALDAGAAAGGFTKTLLDRGARRVYAVDAGHGQLLGSLRQDPRVINLEATNLGSLDRRLVPEPVQIVTLDLSYLSLTAAVPQLDRIELMSGTDLVALVKPMFELHLPRPPDDREQLERALAAAIAGIQRADWKIAGSMESPVRGIRGAVEFFIHAHWT